VSSNTTVSTNLRRNTVDTPYATLARRSVEEKNQAREIAPAKRGRLLGFLWPWLFPGKGNGSGTFGAVKIVGTLAEVDYASRNSVAGTIEDNGYNSFAVRCFFFLPLPASSICSITDFFVIFFSGMEPSQTELLLLRGSTRSCCVR